MKTSAASLLIAIAGFLQESKCMEMFPDTERITGNVVLTLGNQEFTGNLFKAGADIPTWLVREPSEPFEKYKVYFRGCSEGRHEATLRKGPTTSGHERNGVHVRIENIELDSYDHHFERYVYGSHRNLFRDCQAMNPADHVYIAIPETKKVVYIQLETPDAHRQRIQEEELERQMS